MYRNSSYSSYIVPSYIVVGIYRVYAKIYVDFYSTFLPFVLLYVLGIGVAYAIFGAS
jgi:hypothetical protein